MVPVPGSRDSSSSTLLQYSLVWLSGEVYGREFNPSTTRSCITEALSLQIEPVLITAEGLRIYPYQCMHKNAKLSILGMLFRSKLYIRKTYQQEKWIVITHLSVCQSLSRMLFKCCTDILWIAVETATSLHFYICHDIFNGINIQKVC